ncbi:MAG: DUF4373 domain-containing protein [Erysipelotrichaceae bacterium]
MAAPTKKYLSYYNWECNSYDVDSKLQDISFEYGPLGETIYRRMLDLIYSNGYYIEITIDKLSRTLVWKIGSQWLKTNKCVEILTYCVDIGLFDKNLIQSNIWTSVGIQNRYFGIMKQLKRVIDPSKEKYLLIDIVLNAPKNEIPSEETNNHSEETDIYSEETGVNSGKEKEKKQKEIKQNEIIVEERNLEHLLLSSIIENLENRFDKKLEKHELDELYGLSAKIEYSLLRCLSADTRCINFDELSKTIQQLITKGITKLDQYIESED